MQFNSINFIFYFLPLFLAAYYIFPDRFRNTVLILGSFIFYYFAGSNKLLVLGLLLGSILFTYIVAQLLEKKRSGWILGVALVAMTAVLMFFKLYDGGKLLPAGLSFYLFQLAAYLISVYRKDIQADQSLSAFSVQTVMFPKLLMGPLVEPASLQSQVAKPDISISNFHMGLQELILGLGLKVLLANRIGSLWAQAAVVGYESISTPFAWMALVAFAMQLYFDFWGYSLMAMGIGQMLGFKLPENFRDPYASRSVGEFWRRWHASLGAWFRVNIYFPMGGSRKGNLRTVFNLLVVWAFTGIWHGIGGNYLLWAAFLVFLIINERFWLGKLLKKTYVLCHVYTVLAILLSWLPFAVGDWDQMVMYLGRLFGTAGQTLNPNDYIIWGQEYLKLLIAGVICATPLPRMVWNKIKNSFVADILMFVLFWVVVYFIVTSAQDPFMYFQY
jgi:alginate O-acetyltransferase complex protein AlgI